MVTTKEQDLKNVLLELSKFQKQFIDSSQRLMLARNSKLFTLDFLAMAVNNRAISLANAFVTLANEKNYLTAVSLIRLDTPGKLTTPGRFKVTRCAVLN